MGKQLWCWLIATSVCATASAQVLANADALAKLVDFNATMKSDRLLVSIQDSVVADETYRGKPNQSVGLYSITKLFSSLAVGILLEQKRIPHVEVPIAEYFPAWQNDSLKRRITLRHVLQHSSGLVAEKGSQMIYPQSNVVSFALDATASEPPGTRFFYNNRAYNLISGVVKQITGNSLHAFLDTQLMIPLGIRDYTWRTDAAGNTWGMDGLSMRAADLLKIGQLIANRGEWQGKRILSTKWFDLMFPLPLANAMQGTGGYGLGIRTFYFGEQLVIPPATLLKLKQTNLPAAWLEQLQSIADAGPMDYFALGRQFSARFQLEEVERITAEAFKQNLPLYRVANDQLAVMHGGEFGLFVGAVPKDRSVLVRFLGEKWGRKMKADGSDYKYLIDTELIRFMLQLPARKVKS